MSIHVNYTNVNYRLVHVNTYQLHANTRQYTSIHVMDISMYYSNMSRHWSDTGQTLARHWWDIGQTLSRHQSDISQIWIRHQWDTSQKILVRHWSDTGYKSDTIQILVTQVGCLTHTCLLSLISQSCHEHFTVPHTSRWDSWESLGISGIPGEFFIKTKVHIFMKSTSWDSLGFPRFPEIPRDSWDSKDSYDVNY